MLGWGIFDVGSPPKMGKPAGRFNYSYAPFQLMREPWATCLGVRRRACRASQIGPLACFGPFVRGMAGPDDPDDSHYLREVLSGSFDLIPGWSKDTKIANFEWLVEAGWTARREQ